MVTFREILSRPQSKDNAKLIVEAIKQKPSKLKELMELFFDKEMRVCQRAAWPLGMIGSKNPELLIPYLPQLIENLKKPHHDAVIRNTFRIWEEMDIPEDYEGQVYDICFEKFTDVKQAIAIRVFAMTVCANIALKYPELIDEIKPVIEEYYPHGSAGFQSRSKKILKKFQKLTNG